jgi:beta-lactamase class A
VTLRADWAFDAVGGVALRFSLLLAFLAGMPAQAQPAVLKERAEALIAFWNAEAEAETIFSPRFLAAVPPTQIKAIAANVRAELGRARGVRQIVPDAAAAAAVTYAFERGELDVRLAVEPTSPHLVQGLLITASRRADDSFAALADEFRRLPGAASFAVARLGAATPALVAGSDPDRPLAVGSVFKLWLLAELSRQIGAGERRWADVAPLSHKSLPSGFLQDWPAGAPITLHSLAALAISQSDNSASDTLLHLLGRERVEAALPALGAADPRNRPFLSTREAFALKGGDRALAGRWQAADATARRKLLGDLAALPLAQIDIGRLQAGPNQIDTAEWFASPTQLVQTLDWLRRNGRPEALDILAINPGLGQAAARRFSYWGYKGGSEAGVVAMAFLIRRQSGAWYAVAGAWNDPEALVDESRFALLLGRAIALLPE